jgi:DNA-binding CsgD family transcriptional regulator
VKGSRNMVAPLPAHFAHKLSPRKTQTLDALLRGLSEKQVARELNISQHTVHIYVKQLHAQFGVSSRGELLALWIGVPPQITQPTPAAATTPVKALDGPDLIEALIARRARLQAKLFWLDQKLAIKMRKLLRLKRRAAKHPDRYTT